MIEFSESNVKTLIQGGSTVSEIAELFGKSFVETYEMVEKVLPTKRHLKIGEKYWYLFQKGLTLEEIAEKHHSSVFSVTKAITGSGHRVIDEPHLDNANKLDFYRIIVDKNMADRWLSSGSSQKFVEALGELEERVKGGMALFRSQPPITGNREMIGIQIPPNIVRRIDKLSAQSVSLARKKPADTSLSRPKVIRRILEVATGLFPFTPPRPATNALGEPSWRTTFYAPIYAAKLMRDAMGSKGSKNGLTQIFRDAVIKILENPDLIEELPKILVFNTPPHFNKQFAPEDKKLVFAKAIPTSFLKKDATRLRQLIQTRFPRSRGMHRDFMVSLFLWSQNIDQTQIDGWKEWQELCSKCYWEDGDPGIRELINTLIEKEFILTEDI